MKCGCESVHYRRGLGWEQRSSYHGEAGVGQGAESRSLNSTWAGRYSYVCTAARESHEQLTELTQSTTINETSQAAEGKRNVQRQTALKHARAYKRTLSEGRAGGGGGRSRQTLTPSVQFQGPASALTTHTPLPRHQTRGRGGGVSGEEEESGVVE